MTSPRRAARAARSAPARPDQPPPPPRDDPSWWEGLTDVDTAWPDQGTDGMPRAFLPVYAAWRRWRRAQDAYRGLGPDRYHGNGRGPSGAQDAYRGLGRHHGG